MWDGSKPVGQRIPSDGIRLNGRPIDPESRYRVTVNNFLSVGGDGFTAFKTGTNPRFAGYDVDALEAYVKAHSPVALPAQDRIRRLN